MRQYQITIELRSGLGTPLAADTLWGHIAWGIRHRNSDRALTDWLERYDAGDPPLVISDPLPHGFWPRPVLPPLPRSAEPPSVDEADARKQRDKRVWISEEAWTSISSNVSPESVDHAIEQSTSPPTPARIAMTHAAINRLTGGTVQPEGGTLFSNEQAYYDGFPLFDVWGSSPEPIETVTGWFEAGLSGGYGRDAGAGLGNLTIHDVAEKALPQAQDANAVVLLGPAIPAPSDPNRGFFTFGARCGRVGGDFAIGTLPDGSTQRQKRPVRCLLAGTLLTAQSTLPPYVGRVVSGVHPVEAIRQYGIAPVLTCRISGQVVDHPLLNAQQYADSDSGEL